MTTEAANTYPHVFGTAAQAALLQKGKVSGERVGATILTHRRPVCQSRRRTECNYLAKWKLSNCLNPVLPILLCAERMFEKSEQDVTASIFSPCSPRTACTKPRLSSQPQPPSTARSCSCSSPAIPSEVCLNARSKPTYRAVATQLGQTLLQERTSVRDLLAPRMRRAPGAVPEGYLPTESLHTACYAKKGQLPSSASKNNVPCRQRQQCHLHDDPF
jgi:hypothetical protein